MKQIDLPCNLFSERCLLGMGMSSFDNLSEILIALDVEDFFAKEHQELFKIFNEMAEAGKEVSLNSVLEFVVSQGTDAKIKVEQILDIGSFSPTSYVVAELVEDLNDATCKRKMIALAEQMLQEIPGTKKKSGDLMRAYDEILFAIGEKKDQKGPIHIKKVMLDGKPILKELQEMQQAKKDGSSPMAGLPTHFIDLDAKIPGLAPGHLVIIGARPRVGKTTLLLNLVQAMCFTNKTGCLFFSLEMTAKEIGLKCMSLTSGVSYQSMIRGEFGGTDFQKLKEAEQAWVNKCFIIDDESGIGIDQIKTRAIRCKRREPIGVILIDYVQLISCRKKFEARHLEVAEISKQLKGLAKELSCPVVVLAQLNREIEKRTGDAKKPMLSDLRESGSLEADADEVILLHRPDLDDPNRLTDTMQLFIEKNRFGETGLVELNFKKECGKLQNYAKYTKEPNDSVYSAFSPGN